MPTGFRNAEIMSRSVCCRRYRWVVRLGVMEAEGMGRIRGTKDGSLLDRTTYQAIELRDSRTP